MSVRPDEARVQQIGRELFERVAAGRQAFYSSDRWTAALFSWSLQHEDAKLQLFRFVDVLPALDSDRDLVRHLREYFEGRDVPYAGLLRTALGVARVAGRLGDAVVGVMRRETVRRLARRFIAGSTPAEARRAALDARRAGQAFTLDLLGEACLSDVEADAYQARYVELVQTLGREARHWPAAPRLDTAPWGPLPRVNVSVKLSALHPWLEPADPEGGAAAVKRRLRPILEAARANGAHIHVDMEDRRLRDLTLRIFMDLAEEPEFRHERNLGIVLQAYLKDAEADASRLIAWARRRGTPVSVRLVKGAYWDYETAHAELEHWPVPVFETKPEPDASFERLTRLFLEHADAIDLAVGSHNIRSIAHALAAREAYGLAAGRVEFQALYGMAQPLVRALTERGERVRIYMPFGELIPGMAYLVRRLLENTSNESFLPRGFAEHESPDALLADPEQIRVAPPPRVPQDFESEPHADFTRAAVRDDFAAALAAVRSRLGGDHPLVIDGRRVPTAEFIVSVNPSRAGEVVGRVADAGAAEVNHYTREGRGVVGVIAPWNFPLAILTGMTSAALATGNTVVMKPAEQTPVIAARLMEVFEAAGLPPGVVNYAPGRGEVAGDRLVRHPDVALIAFTGSQEVGTRIYATAAATPGTRMLKRVVAEMGGKNAIIVDDDADLDETVQGILTSAFSYAGQKCSACSRVIGVGRVYPRLVERLAEAARTLPMGPAEVPGIVVGPVIDEASRERILSYVDLGKRLARPVLLREPDAALDALGGFYVAPAIFAEVPVSCALAREEIFGPVLSCLPAATFEEALVIATGLDYALTGGVFSRSPVRLARARQAFRVGNLYINRATTGARVGRQPFGGRQLSGIGWQAGGPDYLVQFIETRVVTENTLRRGFASNELA